MYLLCRKSKINTYNLKNRIHIQKRLLYSFMELDVSFPFFGGGVLLYKLYILKKVFNSTSAFLT